tara:strand:- start:319 stop:1356 length:1038 start_codon:yes stop_codon:yes gene_type:complete
MGIMRTVLITGPDGFIGSHCVEHLLVNTDWDIVCVASWRHDGVPDRLSSSVHVREGFSRLKFITHDLTAPFSVLQIDKLLHVTDIIHFAADSNVDRSISHPADVIQNNVNVTLTMLELARTLPSLQSFIQISTDEVYGAAYDGHFHEEWDTILPSNPYSASKAAQEAIAISYWRTYGVPLIITNTMNNIGERQSADKFLPKIIRCALNGDTLDVHAVDGVVGSRVYLHARNHADACKFLIQSAAVRNYPAPHRSEPYSLRPARYNVVGKDEMSNLDLAMSVADIVGKKLNFQLVDAHSQRPGHDLRYALSGAKISKEGWRPPVDFMSSLEKTVLWYLDNPAWLKI